MEESYNRKMNNLNCSGCGVGGGMSDVVLECVMPYIHDPRDRDAVSLVCRRWYELDAITRRHVTIALCYSTSPDRLQRRFKHLESLKMKGKPRAAMFFNLIPEDWGGFVTPWVNEIAESFNCLKSLHFRRMIVKDSDLELLASSRGRVLEVLKLDKCSGFSTDGLSHIGRSCRSMLCLVSLLFESLLIIIPTMELELDDPLMFLTWSGSCSIDTHALNPPGVCSAWQLRTLFLEESGIAEKDGDWLHELATNNTVLQTLNFYMTDLTKVRLEDLELLAKNCRSLVSLKISDFELLELVGFFRSASAIEEFCGGSFNEPDQPGKYAAVIFPPKLCRLGLTYMEKNTRNVIGDRGLEALAQSCKRLKRLRIERGADEQEMEDVDGRVSQRGLIALAQGCLEIEYIAVYVSDITNAALEHLGAYSKNLNDFRLVLLDQEHVITDLPLDNGVRALLRGCEKLQRFGLYLRPGGLSDVGLGYIGQYSRHVRWMILGSVGESDEGLLAFSTGCPSLQKLEMRACCFTESALARAALQLTSLRYLWVHGYRETSTGHRDLLTMVRPFWNIELIPSRKVPTVNNAGQNVFDDNPAHILAYYSLAGPRTDFPDTVKPLDPAKVVAA
uniref:Coronatine-insensitive protein 1 n=1 Tax=Salix viminalis TaxID=40686 RepID=A0A6N2NC53_SALVM